MRTVIIFIGVFFMSNLLKAESVQGWECQYEVSFPGTRSELIAWKLTYKGEGIPREFAHIITPVGEFSFPFPHADVASPYGWQASIYLDGKIVLFRREQEVKRLLSGEEPAFHKCTVTGESGEVSNEASIASKFEERPKGAGADWFYVVKPGLWVNPKKMAEVLKTLPKRS